MLSAETLAALDTGRAAVDKEEEGEDVTPQALLVRTLEGANTNPCFSFRFVLTAVGCGFEASLIKQFNNNTMVATTPPLYEIAHTCKKRSKGGR